MTNSGNPEHNGTHGPSWYDVVEYIRWLERTFNTRCTYTSTATKLKGGPWGLRTEARCERYPECFGCGSYGPAYPGNGSRTQAAAVWTSLHKLQMSIEEKLANERRLVQITLDELARSMD